MKKIIEITAALLAGLVTVGLNAEGFFMQQDQMPVTAGSVTQPSDIPSPLEPAKDVAGLKAQIKKEFGITISEDGASFSYDQLLRILKTFEVLLPRERFRGLITNITLYPEAYNMGGSIIYKIEGKFYHDTRGSRAIDMNFLNPTAAVYWDKMAAYWDIEYVKDAGGQTIGAKIRGPKPEYRMLAQASGSRLQLYQGYEAASPSAMLQGVANSLLSEWDIKGNPYLETFIKLHGVEAPGTDWKKEYRRLIEFFKKEYRRLIDDVKAYPKDAMKKPTDKLLIATYAYLQLERFIALHDASYSDLDFDKRASQGARKNWKKEFVELFAYYVENSTSFYYLQPPRSDTFWKKLSIVIDAFRLEGDPPRVYVFNYPPGTRVNIRSVDRDGLPRF